MGWPDRIALSFLAGFAGMVAVLLARTMLDMPTETHNLLMGWAAAVSSFNLLTIRQRP